MYRILREKLLKIDISGRILLFFASLLLFSIFISGFFFQRVYSSMMTEQIEESSLQTVRSISTNIKTILKNINNTSVSLLSDPSIQNLLKSPDGYKELELVADVNRTISSMMANYNEIYSIYLIDKKKHRYYTDTSANNFMRFNDNYFSRAWWKARGLKGASYYVKNGEYIFSGISGEDFVSNVRVINDLVTQKPIGALLINISVRSLKKGYDNVSGNDGKAIYLFDDKMKLITSSGNYPLMVDNFINKSKKENIKFDLNYEERLIYALEIIEPYGWSVVTVMPIAGGEHLTVLMFTFVITIMVLVVLVILGSMIIAKMITKPINILVDSMAVIGQGQLKKVQFNTTIKEFNSLRDGYNSMTDEIKSLIDRTVFHEKMKRKAELNTLQAQIKPHFLYNTFDSISSLALMGKSMDVHKMVSSLGNFYRISLSKGREVIPLSQELEALKSYLDILKLRYNNFSVDFQITENIGSHNVLKLILQPFVENSIYHGIKPKGEEGEIKVRTYIKDNFLVLEIEDDGVGMEQEDILSLFDGAESFGVKGTIQRIHLFYGMDNLVDISSNRGEGTLVKIKIPNEEMDYE